MEVYGYVEVATRYTPIYYGRHNIHYIYYTVPCMQSLSMYAWYGKSGIGLYHEIEVILLKISKALLLVNNQ